jgi:hypothetical protein
MRRTWLWLVVVGVGVSLHSPQADAKRSAPVDQGYQAATVVSVSRHESYSNYAGDNPSDAPLQARDYAYDIGIRLNCNVYIGRYESAIRYLPSVFAANHEVDVRLRKHVMYISLPYSDDEVMMGIVGHRRVKDEICAAGVPAALSGQVSEGQSKLNKSKGGLP